MTQPQPWWTAGPSVSPPPAAPPAYREPVTVSQAGLVRQGAFGSKTISWPDYFGASTVNGRVLLYRRKQPGGQKNGWPWGKIDLSVTNSIVLPSVLQALYRYFTAK